MRSTLGPYRVVDLLGAGGMGSVYRVVHATSGRIAAAKVLHAGPLAPSASERFRNEARIHSTLQHPHIATMYEYLEVDGQPCIVMEFVDGQTLDQIAQRNGPMALGEALRIFADVVDAVGYIHQRGIMHRDLKANNVKVDSRGQAKLLDFGIAKSHDSPRLTSVGSVVGTLQYLAPEQLSTGRGDHRSDIWALGVLLYEMLTTRLPFEGGAWGVEAGRTVAAAYRPPSEMNLGLPRDIDRIVARCLRARPDDRYASAEALLTDVRSLSAQAGGESTPSLWDRASVVRQSGELLVAWRQQGRLVASIAAALAGLLVFTWAVWSDPQQQVPESPVTATPVRPPGRLPNTQTTANNPIEATHSGLLVPPPEPDARDVILRPVIIRVLQGQADVFRDGIRVGQTPFEARLPLGAEVSLTLKQNGCQDEPVLLRVAEGSQEYLQNMRCRRDP